MKSGDSADSNHHTEGAGGQTCPASQGHRRLTERPGQHCPSTNPPVIHNTTLIISPITVKGTIISPVIHSIITNAHAARAYANEAGSSPVNCTNPYHLHSPLHHQHHLHHCTSHKRITTPRHSAWHPRPSLPRARGCPFREPRAPALLISLAVTSEAGDMFERLQAQQCRVRVCN